MAVATDGNGRYCYLDPRMGGRIAVAEAARNVSCTGATPLAATDCLNFGNPEKPAVYYQLQQAVEGMVEACTALGAPVVSGNVSLYNESGGEPIYPTPVVGVLGLLADVRRSCPSRFQEAGDVIALLGDTFDELGASEYLEQVHGLVAGRVPHLDLEREAADGVVQAHRPANATDTSPASLALETASARFTSRVRPSERSWSRASTNGVTPCPVTPCRAASATDSSIRSSTSMLSGGGFVRRSPQAPSCQCAAATRAAVSTSSIRCVTAGPPSAE